MDGVISFTEKKIDLKEIRMEEVSWEEEAFQMFYLSFLLIR
jgi:hypothetical protein